MNAERAGRRAGHNLKLKNRSRSATASCKPQAALKFTSEYIDEFILTIKKLVQLCDQKDERIKELSRDLNNINYWLQAAIKKTQLNNRVKK